MMTSAHSIHDCMAITVDIDWAPDWAIAELIDLLVEHDAKATFFVTHETPVLERIRANTRFEMGIHPNFLPGSCHGADMRSVMDFSLKLVPEARAMRTHALVQSDALLWLVGDEYPAIDTDVSLLLPFHDGLRPVDSYRGAARRRLTRLPYYWEDDICGERPDWRWTDEPPRSSGLRIFDFHPAYVALNMVNMDGYRQMKQDIEPLRLNNATREHFAPYVVTGPGTRSFLDELLRVTPKDDLRTISEITDAHRRGAP